MATAHINAELGDFAPAVLMPGDPRRAQRIAEEILDDYRQVSDVRGMLGFTGTVNGKPLSVMGSGMGQPSAAIYANELFQFFGVERIVRVGTCGGIAKQVGVGDIVIAMGSHTDSNFNQKRIPGVYFSAIASYSLLHAAAVAGKDLDNLHVGTVIARDHFYGNPAEQNEALASYGVLGVDMESAALYGVASQHGKEALTILTVSDHLFDPSTEMDSQERETHFHTALDLAVVAAHA